MAVPRLAVLLVVGVLLIPAVFVMSRVATGGAEESPPPPKPAKAAAKPAAPATKPEVAHSTAADAPAQPKPDPAVAARKKAAAAGLPASVAVALAQGKTVVLLLSDNKAADDHSTADAVHSLKVPNVKIFSDRLSRLGSYRAIVSRVGVSQTPAVVIVRGSKARVVEGYVDPETLRQQVLDAKR
jgi:hypothetical protein